MGFLKIVFLIATPIGVMTVSAFSLGRKLPGACRLFGNYIGLSYVYFKAFITMMKPQDHLTYEMIDIARKTTQQSQALRREMRNTLKRAKQEVERKRDQTFTELNNEFLSEPNLEQALSPSDKKDATSSESNLQPKLGRASMIEMQKKRRALIETKEQKTKAKRFYSEF